MRVFGFPLRSEDERSGREFSKRVAWFLNSVHDQVVLVFLARGVGHEKLNALYEIAEEGGADIVLFHSVDFHYKSVLRSVISDFVQLYPRSFSTDSVYEQGNLIWDIARRGNLR